MKLTEKQKSSLAKQMGMNLVNYRLKSASIENGFMYIRDRDDFAWVVSSGAEKEIKRILKLEGVREGNEFIHLAAQQKPKNEPKPKTYRKINFKINAKAEKLTPEQAERVRVLSEYILTGKDICGGAYCSKRFDYVKECNFKRGGAND